MDWFEFSQNNSGGVFVVNDTLTHRVFIQAEDDEEAVAKALDMGVYFDGVEEGIDCECCGDRWYWPKKIPIPLRWDDETTFHSVEAYAQYVADRYGWCKPDARLFFADGSVLEVFK